MSEARSTFHRIEKGLPLLLQFDPSARMGDPSREICVLIGLDLEETAAKGLPTADEAEFLSVLERFLVERSPEELGLDWVGRRSGHGRADLCFYAASAPSLEGRLRALLARWPERLFDLRVLRDEDWQCFREVFLPRREEALSMANLAAIERCLEAGFELVQPHRVRHVVELDDAAAAQRFGEALRAGAELSVFAMEVSGTTVEIELEHDLRLASVELASHRLRVRVEAAGGQYREWRVSGPLASE